MRVYPENLTYISKENGALVKSPSLDLFLEVVDWVCICYSLVLIVVGCCCNPLSFIVLSRRAFRSSTMSIYLRILTLSDLGVILNGLVPSFLGRAFAISVVDNYLSCFVNTFIYFLLLYSSSWLLVIVTAERVMSIVWPHRVHILCSRCAVAAVLISLFTLLGLLSIPGTLLFGDLETINQLLNTTTVLHCVPKAEKVSQLFLITDGTFFAFLPSLLLVIFNIIIVFGVIRSRKRTMKVPANEYFSNEATRTNFTRSLAIVAEENFSSAYEFSHNPKNSSKSTQHQRSRRRARETSLTLTLVAISTTFIVCNFPPCVWGFGPQYQSEAGLGPVGFAFTDLLGMLMYSNNGLNFVLYCLTGSKFRSEVRAVFKDVLRSCGLEQKQCSCLS